MAIKKELRPFQELRRELQRGTGAASPAPLRALLEDAIHLCALDVVGCRGCRSEDHSCLGVMIWLGVIVS